MSPTPDVTDTCIQYIYIHGPEDDAVTLTNQLTLD